MKNKKFKRVFILIVCALILGLSFPAAANVAHAASNISYSETQVGDSALYNTLRNISKKNGGSGVLRETTFNSERFETLDLSTYRQDGSPITQISSLDGLKLFALEYTKTLNISNNALTEIDPTVLTNIPQLETLIVNGNQLTNLDLTGCTRLKVVEATGNYLTSFNGTSMVSNGFSIDLSRNNFTDFNEIKLPEQITGANGDIRLYNNNISNYTSAGNYRVYLGLQGLYFNTSSLSNETIREKSEKIVYYKSEVHNVRFVISNDSGVVQTINDYEVKGNTVNVPLEIGEYELNVYYIDVADGHKAYPLSTKQHAKTNKANSADYYDKVEGIYKYYDDVYVKFSVIPSTPTYKYLIKDKYYDESEVGKLKQKAKIILNGDSGADLYYRYGANGEWKQGNEINLTKGGTYFIEVQARVGESVSRTSTILINAEASLTVPSILLIFLILGVGALIFAVGIPLLKKYVL